MNINEKQFIAGFNSGYILAEFEPQMVNILLKTINPENSYISGMFFGQREFEINREIDNLKSLRSTNKIQKQR